MPPNYVKPYVKRNENDAADAEAICEVVTRSNMRFHAVKSAEQQGVLMLNRTRELLVRQRTMLVNAIRARLHKLIADQAGEWAKTSDANMEKISKARKRGLAGQP